MNYLKPNDKDLSDRSQNNKSCLTKKNAPDKLSIYLDVIIIQHYGVLYGVMSFTK